MCNLYRLEKSAGEVAALFRAIDKTSGANIGAQIYPKDPGIVVAVGQVRRMTWGVPLVLKSKKTGKPLKPKPVNNARADKLDSYMWRSSFENRRCLIPLTAWAEAEGAKGSKTRTWLSMPETDLFACAGLWRDTDEWGPCYSMVMTDAAGDAAAVHDRVPVLLKEEMADDWLTGSPDTALQVCEPLDWTLDIARTDESWVQPAPDL